MNIPKAWVIHFDNPSQNKSGIIAGPFFDEQKAKAELASYKSRPLFAVSTFALKSVKEIEEPEHKLCLIYNGGTIDYWASHPLPAIVVTLYSTTTMGQLYETLCDKISLMWEILSDKYGELAINKALFWFYQTEIRGRTKETFAKFSREETRDMAKCGEGCAFIFVLGRPVPQLPFGPVVVYP